MPNLSKKNLIAVGAIVVITGSIVFSMLNQKNHGRPAPGSREQETADLRMLEKADANWAEQSQALMRLSIQQKPEALAFIKRKFEAKDERLTPWATRALGYFTNPEAFELIRGQLGSTNSTIREAAIDALGMRSHPEKLKMIEEAKAMVKGDAEHARLQMASIRMTANPEAKSSLAKGVVSQLQRRDLDSAARNYLVSQIFFQSPRTREVESYFNSLSSNIKGVDELSAIAVVRALKIYCPANRFSVIKEALARPALTIPGQSQILNELIFHAGPEATAIFQSNSSGGKLNATFLDNLKKQLENPKMKSPCSTQQAAAPAAGAKRS
jgi:hypothetical protein